MQLDNLEYPIDVLDPAQLKRIEFVHKGFLYQHLYAVGCLLVAASSGVKEVLVELDEDIELSIDGGRVYVQVKTRSLPIMPGDVAGALERFDLIKAEHEAGRRFGEAQFVIVANQVLGQTLQSQVDQGRCPSDLLYVCPEGDAPRLDCLPPAWRNLEEAALWCIAQAEKLNFSLLSPSSLVWKLAGLVTLASAGGGRSSHVFRTSDLPDLFEQLIVQLQDFPTPPQSYRPQQHEPVFVSPERVRIVCGLSGAGKTTWAAHSALHSPEQCTYYDVGDLPGPAIASSILRELASKYSKRDPEGIRKILLPGASGFEAIRAFDRFLEQDGNTLLVVIDNAHRVPVANMRDLLNATRHIRFILLCQPHENVRELEALMSLRRESLKGWDLDTVAGVVHSAGASGSPKALEQLRIYTGGLPLYVESATKIASSEYGGSIDLLCSDLAQQANVAETAQEIILTRVYTSFDQATQDALAIVSLADVGLAREEVVRVLAATFKLSPAGAAATIKKIQSTGTVEVFGAKTLKVHDAVRAIGLRHLELMSEEQVNTALVTLTELLIQGLEKNRDTSRFSLLTQIFIRLQDVETLIGLAGEEVFYEMGVSVDITSDLEHAVDSGALDPHQAFWALDGIVFSHMREGRFDAVSDRLPMMEQLLREHGFEFREQLAWAFKKLMFASERGMRLQVQEAIDYASPKIPDAAHQRIFDYTHAIAMWKLKRPKQAETLCLKVIGEYYELLGLTPAEVMGKNADVLWAVINRPPNVHEDLKHLADALELYAITRHEQGLQTPFARIHAMKFYSMIEAYESLVRLGQDAADEFVAVRDYVGAKEVIEQHVLPVITHAGLIPRMIQVRSQYAVILALAGDHRSAVGEIKRLLPYLDGLEEHQRREVKGQADYIAHIISEQQHRVATFSMGAVGRNERCPCGSGLKFKKCHGM
ncbi:SEC-C metal-binding domain-containing protein [Pseudomonas viridiflava]|uniref:SEC-C metal-binding domain-containing protein n=1 Tax=Pseudomonas viridiflava TaxID=33069 RepID=UPI000F02443B|nr:SEC-C metal-binding domain-containing protein [Pseudomonas viridiflava]